MRGAGATVLIAATAACLPRGTPPAGSQLITDRAASLAALVPPNGDGLLRILVMRPGPTSDSADLSVVTLDADNQLSPERLLISDIDPVSSVNCPGGVAPCGFDDDGRVQIFEKNGGSALLDPVTGQIEALNLLGQHAPGEPYFASGMTQTSGTFYDRHGGAIPIQLAPPDSNGPYFPPYTVSGSDFYYLDAQHNLIDIPPSDVPEQVATAVTYYSFWTTPDGPLLVLTRTTADGTGSQSSIGDPRSGMETVLPFDASLASLSPNGRWVVYPPHNQENQYTFFDRSSGAQSTVALGQPTLSLEWRPATSEVWVSTVDPNDSNNVATVWILRPDAPDESVRVPGVRMWGVATNGGWGGASFTADGKYWFSTPSRPDVATTTIQVGAAADPTGPRYNLNPPETYLSQAWYLPDGRLLTTSWPSDSSRADANLLDPRTGERRTLGRRGVVDGVGQTRFMGMFHVYQARGDLVAGGFDTADSTVLAPEFTVRAFAEPQGDDLLAPGTRIVYQFQARTASPYDGIWVTECP
ncbi:MAG TPA: hypothetical protein VN962_04255 [Polyangia bacterium]|nr:hypothetical protein [Polyangia bacterium]